MLTAALSHAKEAVRLVRRLTRRQTGPRVSQPSDPGPLSAEAEAEHLIGLAFNAGMVLAAAHAAAGNRSEALAAYQKLIDDGRFPDVCKRPPRRPLLQAHAIPNAAAVGVVNTSMLEH